jgi:hypothetical protein
VEKRLGSGWSDFSGEMRPGNAVGVLSVLYIGQGDEVRGRGRKCHDRWWFSISAVSKPKRRGRGDARAPLDEGNGGGTGGALLPLPPSTGGHPMVACGAAAPGAAAAAST